MLRQTERERERGISFTNTVSTPIVRVLSEKTVNKGQMSVHPIRQHSTKKISIGFSAKHGVQWKGRCIFPTAFGAGITYTYNTILISSRLAFRDP